MYTNTVSSFLLASVCLSCQSAHAGFAFDQPYRGYAVAITSGIDLQRTNTVFGHFQDSIYRAQSNDFGTTSVKMDVESTLNTNVYKSATFIRLRSSELSPRDQFTGGSTSFFNNFDVDVATTIQIAFQFIDNGTNENSYTLRLTDSIGNLLINEYFTDSHAGSFTLNLAAGKYLLEDASLMQGLNQNQSGTVTLSSTLSMNIVPAPSTLALLLPTTLIATRRRR